MPPQKVINVELYTKHFSERKTVTAQQAKEIFFLTPDDLKYLDYRRPKTSDGGNNNCRKFIANQVRCTAIRKFGSVASLTKKAKALNTRRRSKAEREKAKRYEELRRRLDEAAEAERKRLADIEAKKQAQMEQKNEVEQQTEDAESWRALVKALEETNATINSGDPSALASLLQDINGWKKNKTPSETPKTTKKVIAF